MFFTEDLTFSCTKPTNIYTFQESLGFSQKFTQRMQNKKSMPGHVLRELHHFLESNKKQAEQKTEKKETHIEPKNTRSKNKKKHSFRFGRLRPISGNLENLE